MAGVVFTQSAQTDLLEAWLFIAEENQTAADRTLDAIAHQAQASVARMKRSEIRD